MAETSEKVETYKIPMCRVAVRGQLPGGEHLAGISFVWPQYHAELATVKENDPKSLDNTVTGNVPRSMAEHMVKVNGCRIIGKLADLELPLGGDTYPDLEAYWEYMSKRPSETAYMTEEEFLALKPKRKKDKAAS